MQSLYHKQSKNQQHTPDYVARANFTQVPNVVHCLRDVSAYGVRMLLYFMQFEEAYPSVSHLTERLQCGRNTVIKTRQELLRAGYIVRIDTPTDAHSQQVRTAINWDALWQLNEKAALEFFSNPSGYALDDLKPVYETNRLTPKPVYETNRLTPKPVYETNTNNTNTENNTTERRCIDDKETRDMSTDALYELVDCFAEASGQQPTDANWVEHWIKPLVAIYKATEQFDLTKEAITAAVAYNFEKGLPVYTPASIQKGAIYRAKQAASTQQTNVSSDPAMALWQWLRQGGKLPAHAAALYDKAGRDKLRELYAHATDKNAVLRQLTYLHMAGGTSGPAS